MAAKTKDQIIAEMTVLDKLLEEYVQASCDYFNVYHVKTLTDPVVHQEAYKQNQAAWRLLKEFLDGTK